MGSSYLFHCMKCGYKFDAFLGTGFIYPVEYQQIMHDAAAGKYGESVREFLASHPDGVLNCDRVLLQCTCCDVLKVMPDLSMYVSGPDCSSGPRDGGTAADSKGYWNFAAPWDLKEYQLVSHYEHTCEKCGKPMKKVAVEERIPLARASGSDKRRTRIHCPVCRDKMYLDCISCWD